MDDSIDSSEKPSGTERWAVGVPVAAALSVIFFARAWGVPWSGPTVVVVALVGWLVAVAARWSWPRRSGERWWTLAGAAVVVVVLGYAVGWRLPRGLVMAGWPVLGLAALDVSFGRGRCHPSLVRLAIGGVAVVVLFAILVAPVRLRVEWSAGLAESVVFLMRAIMAAAVVTVAAHAWRQAADAGLQRGARRLVRSVVFAAGVWLPLVWWHPRGLLSEFMRLENASFLALVFLVAWARREPDFPDRPGADRRLQLAALGLLVVAVIGWLQGWREGMDSLRAVYEGVAVGALVMAAGAWWRDRYGARGRAVTGSIVWPELALVMMGLTAWVR